MILAIDTSTEQASIALLEGETVRSEWSWTARRNHSRQLTPAIETVLDMEEVHLAQLTAIVVASGPGSFSGVRVGISHGKGLAMALAIPLVGISTLDAIAFQASISGGHVWAAIPAGRGQLYLAHYAGNPDSWTRLSEYLLVSTEEAASLLSSSHSLAGPGAELLSRTSPQAREADATSKASEDLRAQGTKLTAPLWLALRRAGFLAELGRRYLASGGNDQLDSLEPLYLRQSAAEEKRAATLGS